ncbi:uncharacterized protein C15orf39 homolog isoform X1 [Notechis scutatus]|uniref:Uncharacterized protein C15orf39 homolog isoform X1 n=1 Tax=Notechis scutatus TaxID=8663 RepID=A0A6J1VJE4_9SAUR|nr:uncharacterized protein C15orf39 homolog isoform X1 [Notechis scutatus]XP_026543060.1 uncharacterized protein C15orf39 homolog isoform X1 [Notechis scutatus]
MAEKRTLESVSTMSYSKLPRLEGEPTHILPVGLCRSSRLPDLPTEDHYSYKGSYFTFPFPCHEAPKTLTHWSAAENYNHCPAGAPDRSPRTEKTTCQSEMESLKARQRLAGSQKVNECTTREQWASYVGHAGVIQQGWLQGYPTQQLPPAPAACSTLAAPKPVYQSHAYGAESGYAPKRALAFRMQMENYSKRLEWSSPSSVLPTGAESRGYGTAGSKKTSVAENSVVQFRHGSKEGDVHSSGFMPYHKALEKCQGAQNGSSSYSSVSHKSNSESPAGSNSRKHMWSRLPPSPLPPPPPPSSLLLNSQDLAYQERSPSCYPLGSYPLTSHEQMLLYHQSYVQAEKTNSVFALAACKGFGSPPGHEDGQVFPRSYFQQTSHSYYPGHLESYFYQAMGPPPLTPSEELHPSREHEHSHNATAKGDFTPKTPAPACAVPEKPASASSPWRSRGGLPDWCESSRVAREASANSSTLQAFPSIHQVDRLSHCYNRVEKMEESGCKKDLCPPEKVTEKEEESSEMHKNLSLTYESRKRSIDAHNNEPGGCIIVPDSPVISHNPYSKPVLPKNVLKAPDIQSTSHGHWSPEGQPEGLHKQREGPSTSSPPMPVINNVFSLAPYRAYLEGSADLVELDATKRCQAEELPPKSGGKSVDNGCVPWTGSQRTTKESRLNLPREEGTTHNTRMKSGDAGLNKNNLPIGQAGGDYAGSWESYKVQLLNPTDLVSCQPSPDNLSDGRVERLSQEDRVLDLSFKTEDLAERPDLLQPGKKAKAPDVGGPKIQGEEVEEKAADSQGSVSQANGETLVLPINGDARGSRHFHSSAAFLFKKFKVLKAHAAEAASGVKDASLPKGTDSQVTQPNSPLLGLNLPQTATPSETLILQIKCLNATLPDASTLLLPSGPPGSPALRETQVLDPATEKLLGQKKPPRQYFTALHSCVCTIISGSVSTSSPDQLKEWLEMSESTVGLQEKTVSSTKPKNGLKVSEGPKLSKGKEIWLAFKDVEVLVKKLQSQLEIFLLYNKCPFPHVMRAGATFIPIHVVKEELFPNLPGVSVDHVLQDHKVELRPTTLSEEKALRDLDLKSCTSRMLKLLALKQLPDIYLDLLTLHWHECVKQQLEDPAKLIPNSDVEALGTDATTESLDQNFPEKNTKGKTCGLAASLGTTSLHYETLQPEDKETLARCSSPSLQRGCVLTGMKVLPKEDAALETEGSALCPGARRPSHKQPRTLKLKLTAKVASRTTRASEILHLRKSMVHIQFQNALQDIQGPQILGPSGKGKKVPPPLLLKRFKRRRHSRAKVSSLPSEYPELVGKRIRHLYEEKDKTEAWYQGVVLRIHKPHKNPLKTVYEVKYDSEPEWQYYLEILQDYKKGWVELEE